MVTKWERIPATDTEVRQERVWWYSDAEKGSAAEYEILVTATIENGKCGSYKHWSSNQLTEAVVTAIEPNGHTHEYVSIQIFREMSLHLIRDRQSGLLSLVALKTMIIL